MGPKTRSHGYEKEICSVEGRLAVVGGKSGRVGDREEPVAVYTCIKLGRVGDRDEPVTHYIHV